MVTDKNGRELKVGDEVWVKAKITYIYAEEKDRLAALVLVVDEDFDDFVVRAGSTLAFEPDKTPAAQEELNSVGELGAHLFTRRNRPL